MAPIIVRYPLDETGINPNNLVQNEPHTLVNRLVRSIAPLYGAFYSDSLIITDVATNRPLVRNQQWYPAELYEVPTAKYGKEVHAIIIITDASVSSNVLLQYQAIGGEYSTSELAIAQQIANLNLDNRPVSWPEIMHRPADFPPSMHLHDIGDVYGFEYLVHALERLRTAIEFGDQVSHDTIFKYIDSADGKLAAQLMALLGTIPSTSSTVYGTITNLINDLAAEVTNRQAADDSLLRMVQKETTDRTAGDTALQTALTDGLALKAAKAGSANQAFNVKDAVNATEAVALGQMTSAVSALDTAYKAADATETAARVAAVNQVAGDLTTHINAADPHPQYTTVAELSSAITTSLTKFSADILAVARVNQYLDNQLNNCIGNIPNGNCFGNPKWTPAYGDYWTSWGFASLAYANPSGFDFAGGRTTRSDPITSVARTIGAYSLSASKVGGDTYTRTVQNCTVSPLNCYTNCNCNCNCVCNCTCNCGF